jgi:hypothetical protein
LVVAFAWAVASRRSHRNVKKSEGRMSFRERRTA